MNIASNDINAAAAIKPITDRITARNADLLPGEQHPTKIEFRF